MQSPRKRVRNENTITYQSMKYFKNVGDKIVDGIPKEYFECSIRGSHINGQKQANLASHLLHKHTDIYNEFAIGKKRTRYQ